MDLKEIGLQRIKFNSRGKPRNIIAKEGDRGARGLLVEFEEGLDCKLYMNDDTVIADEVDGGLYELIYPDNLKKGIVPAEIKFYKDEEVLSNYIFDIRVYKSLEEVEY